MKEPWLNFWHCEDILHFSTAPRQPAEITQLPNLWVLGLFPRM
jgi:hypothetical protein